MLKLDKKIDERNDFVIKNDKFCPYGNRNGFSLVKGKKGKCPKCGSRLYIHDGGDQGGIAHIECTNGSCPYISYKVSYK